MLSKRVMEHVDENLAKSGQSSKPLYDALTMTDKGQMREFYLTKIEEVSNPKFGRTSRKSTAITRAPANRV